MSLPLTTRQVSQTQLPVITELADLVDNLLGDSHYKSITPKMANCILAVTANRHTCYVQTHSHDGDEYEYPVLWYYHQWTQSVDRWKIARERARKEQEAEWILAVNVQLVKRALLKRWLLTEPHAEIIGSKWLKQKGNEWKVVGLGIKLKTKMEEI